MVDFFGRELYSYGDEDCFGDLVETFRTEIGTPEVYYTWTMEMGSEEGYGVQTGQVVHNIIPLLSSRMTAQSSIQILKVLKTMMSRAEAMTHAWGEKPEDDVEPSVWPAFTVDLAGMRDILLAHPEEYKDFVVEARKIIDHAVYDHPRLGQKYTKAAEKIQRAVRWYREQLELDLAPPSDNGFPGGLLYRRAAKGWENRKH